MNGTLLGALGDWEMKVSTMGEAVIGEGALDIAVSASLLERVLTILKCQYMAASYDSGDGKVQAKAMKAVGGKMKTCMKELYSPSIALYMPCTFL